MGQKKSRKLVQMCNRSSALTRVSLKIEFQIHCTAKNKVCSSEGNKLEINWYENTCNF